MMIWNIAVVALGEVERKELKLLFAVQAQGSTIEVEEVVEG